VFEFGSDFRVVHRARKFDHLLEVEAVLGVLGEATGCVAEQRVARQPSIESAGLTHIDVPPQALVPVAAGEVASAGLGQHVERRGREALANHALRAEARRSIGRCLGAVRMVFEAAFVAGDRERIARAHIVGRARGIVGAPDGVPVHEGLGRLRNVVRRRAAAQ